MSDKIVRNSKGLVGAMFDELDALKNGESTPQQARAKASIANTICQVTRLEIDFARFVAAERSDPKGLEQKPAGLQALPME